MAGKHNFRFILFPPLSFSIHCTDLVVIAMMKVILSLLALTTSFMLNGASAFSVSNDSRTHTAGYSSNKNRRDFISTAITTSSVAIGGLAFPPPSLADVSDGNSLPQGAAQFSRLIKVRAQLKVMILQYTRI